MVGSFLPIAQTAGAATRQLRSNFANDNLWRQQVPAERRLVRELSGDAGI